MRLEVPVQADRTGPLYHFRDFSNSVTKLGPPTNINPQNGHAILAVASLNVGPLCRQKLPF